MKNGKSLSVREGILKGGLSFIAEGSGPPLVLFRSVMPSSKNPTGMARWAEKRLIRPLTQRFTVYAIGRRPGLLSGTTMADLAADYAHAIEEEFKGNAVDVVGMSTGGSIALQFAADYPGLVHRLALVATAYRLGPVGRDVQSCYADLLAAGNSRKALKALATGITASRSGQWLLGGFLWLLAPLSPVEDPSGTVAMLMAEDAFDLGDRLGEIAAPTLLIGGDCDRNYSPDLIKQTAERSGSQTTRWFCNSFFVWPPPNEVGYRRGTIERTHGPVPLPSSRTGLDRFRVIRLSGPCFRNAAVDVPAWISSWHFRHTIKVLRRRAAICLTHTGFSLRPGFSRSASLRI